MPKSRLHQGLGRNASIFGQQRFFQGTTVDSDTDGDPPYPARLRHRLHPLRGPDVAGVDAHLIRSGGYCLQCQPIVEMDVHHQRNGYLLPDRPDGPCCGHVGDRHPNDLTPRRLQAFDLRHGGRDIVGPGIAHRLDGNGSVPPHGNAPNKDLFCHSDHPIESISKHH